MDREIWFILWLSLGVFCGRFCFGVWVKRKITRRLLGYYRKKQVLSSSEISCLAGYNPFNVVKQVASLAGIAPPELFVISKFPHGIVSFCLGNFIVCSESFIKDTPEKEFEGVIGHEFGHLMNTIELLFRSAHHSFFGFLWCGGFLLLAFLRFAFSRIWEGEPLISADFIFWAGLLFCAFLLGGLCFVAYRVLEKQREFFADKRGLLLTRYPQDFINRVAASGNTKHSHPPTRKRVEFAKKILRKPNAVQ